MRLINCQKVKLLFQFPGGCIFNWQDVVSSSLFENKFSNSQMLMVSLPKKASKAFHDQYATRKNKTH